jgi:calcineurin-like phosphoesterase family protein
MADTFYSSDWHLGHKRIIELCDRPFASVEEMNREILERCNDTVRENDRLFLLGDHVMGSYAENVELLRQIRCRNVTLLPGNHDRWSLAYRNSPARRSQAANQLRGWGFTVLEDNVPSWWPGTTDAGNPVLMSHYPYAGDSQDEDRHAEMRPPGHAGFPLIHGHVHEKWQTRDRMINVGVDVWDFTPVPSEEVDAWISTLYT